MPSGRPWGERTGANISAEIEGDLFGDHALTGSGFPLNTVKLLTPCVPSKMLALGLNYALHVQESGSDRQAPTAAGAFLQGALVAQRRAIPATRSAFRPAPA